MAQAVAISPTQMDDQLRAYVEAGNRHAIDEMLALRHPDAYLDVKGVGVRVSGHAGLRSHYETFFAQLPDYRLELEGAAFGDNVAAVWARMTGTVGESFMGLRARGGRIDVPIAFVCTFLDGQFHGDHAYFDSAQLREQAGIENA